MPQFFIHVGFSNTGTTSLQKNFFRNRPDIFFVGEPYADLGGIFYNIKTVEDFAFPLAQIEELLQQRIYAPSAGRAIVISDETLCDTPQQYFSPFAMPRDIIAQRLKHLFPGAKIIFSIRDQRSCVASLYLNLKRNYALFAGVPIHPFSEWLAGLRSQPSNPHLRNLNFMETIALYSRLFGPENICVLPLESLIVDGVHAYLRKVCEFIGLQLTDGDVANYAVRQNARMTARRNLFLELSCDRRCAELFAALAESFGSEQLNTFLDGGSPVSVMLEQDDVEDLRRRVGIGNRLLDRAFGLNLQRYDYLLADDGELERTDLSLNATLSGFSRYVDMLQTSSDSKRALMDSKRASMKAERAVLRSAEVEARNAVLQNELAEAKAQLQRLAAELASIRQSVSWRITRPLRRVRGLLAKEPRLPSL